jgi:hypothetical protein
MIRNIPWKYVIHATYTISNQETMQINNTIIVSMKSEYVIH